MRKDDLFNPNVNNVLKLMKQVESDYANHLIETDKDFCSTELEEWKQEAIKEKLINEVKDLLEGR